MSMDIPADSLVCRPCRQDVTRVIADAGYIPRWGKESRASSNSYCCVRKLSIANTSMCSSDELKQIQDIEFQSELIPPLCKSHYHAVYDALQTRHKNCRTCGRRLRIGNDRPCPQPHVIQKYLSEHTDFTGEIVNSDRVCLTCYKCHLVLLKDNQPMSTDSDLQSLVVSISTQGKSAHMVHDIIRIATNHMLIEENRATLLPAIYSSFLQHTKHLVAQGMQEPPELKMVNCRWILCEITSKYQHHVTYTCKVRKHGTLVYRPTSDLHALLSDALWKLKQVHSESVRSEDATPASTSSSTVLNCSIGRINKLIHAQIDSYLGTHDNPFDYDELDVDEQVSNIDPQLWNAMCCLTRSKSEIRGTSKAINPGSPAFHVKKVRRFFLLCAIMFNVDDRCSMPMHTLITDVVESQGGSSVLVKILNRLGVCSSADTLARFIQHKQCTSDQNQFRHMSRDAFTVVSADNHDFMHSFARVFCGKQQSSWHGTTVQVVQPLPSLSSTQDATHTEYASITQCSAPQMSVTHTTPSEDQSISQAADVYASLHSTTHGDNTGASSDSQEGMSALATGRHIGGSSDHADGQPLLASRKRIERSSPFPSPMKMTRSPLAKQPRRLRTGTEGRIPQNTLPTHLPEPTYHRPCQRNDLTQADFVCNAGETQSQLDLQCEMNVYMMHRVAFQKINCTHPFLDVLRCTGRCR